MAATSRIDDPRVVERQRAALRSRRRGADPDVPVIQDAGHVRKDVLHALSERLDVDGLRRVDDDRFADAERVPLAGRGVR